MAKDDIDTRVAWCDNDYAGPHTYRTKLDYETSQALDEAANKYAKGNVSGLIRQFVLDGLENINDMFDGIGSLSPTIRAYVARKRWFNRQQVRQQLREDWNRLKQEHMPELEKAARTLAEEHKMKWPPEDMPIYEANKDLKCVLTKIKFMWGQDNESVSVRDLQRGLSKYKADKLREMLDTLENEGVVQTICDQSGKAVSVEPPPLAA